MENIDHTDQPAHRAGKQNMPWTVEDRTYALAMHIDLDWNELNILSRCVCDFPNVPNSRCIVCERESDL